MWTEFIGLGKWPLTVSYTNCNAENFLNNYENISFSRRTPLTQLGDSVISRIWAWKPRDHGSTAMCPDRLWDSLSFLYRRLFSGSKVEEEQLIIHLHPVTMLYIRESIYLSVQMSSWRAQGRCLSLCTNTSPDLGSSSSLQRVPFALWQWISIRI